MTDLPLTDDQLRQVAAHMATEYGRDQVNDRLGIGDMLDEVLEKLDIDLMDANGDSIEAYELDDDVFEAILDRIRDLIRDATITVEWPDSAVRATDFAGRDALKTRIHPVLHDLNVRIVGLDNCDCHCNLIADVILDALAKADA
jgi:hypothetical protein